MKKPNHFAVPELLRHFYQAEVLVPSPIPPHLISIPRIKRTLGKPKIAKAAKATTATSSTAAKDVLLLPLRLRVCLQLSAFFFLTPP